MKKVLTILAILMLLAGGTAYAIPQIERQALIALYESTDGDNWSYDNDGWKTPPLAPDGFAMPGTECGWAGVYCGEYSVSRIYLGVNQLSGSIPPELGNLANLKSLRLNWNQLSGNIPAELGNLTQLEHLELWYNQLTGPLPVELSNLPNLRSINLSSNQLTGAIPPEWGNLNNLQYLDLSDNQLNGPVPNQFGNLNSLDRLNLDRNLLSGSIPPELGNLNNLTELYLSQNQLSGPIPPELSELNRLRWVHLSSNQLNGPIPLELMNLTDLFGLRLHDNQLTGPIPPEIGNLTRLFQLSLDSNQLTGTVPPELGNLTGLIELALSSNRLTGTIPPEFRNLIHMRYLDIADNQLTGSIPAELGDLIHMVYLRLDGNQLTGNIPAELGNITHMEELGYFNFSNNQLTGTIPPELGNLSLLDILDLSNNHLIGPIPTELMNLTGLYDLNICYNYLYTEDDDLRDLLNSLQPGWEDCQHALPEFLFTPASLIVPAVAGSSSFDVANAGGGALSWTATVTSGDDWLSITSGSSGIDAGTVDCTYSQNDGSERVGTIRFESVTEQSHDFQVTQAAATHTLNTSVSPSGGGAVTRSPNEITFTHNGSVQLTATPSPGYTFSNWSGDAAGSSNPISITMASNTHVTAHFFLIGQPNVVGEYLSIDTLTPAERDFLLDIGDGTRPFPDISPIKAVHFQNDTATIDYADGRVQVVNVKHGNGYADDFINAVLFTDTSEDIFTTLLNLPSFDAELEYPGNRMVICYPGISPVGSGPGIQLSDLALLKLKPVGQPSIPFAYRVDSGNAPADGDYWFTNHLQESILPLTDTIDPGRVVDLYLAVDDNGLYDLDETSNVIVDPLVLGLIEKKVIVPPSELTYPTTSNTGSFTVSWSAVTGAVSYRLEHSADGGDTWSLRYTGDDRSFAESVGNGSYRYRVLASDASNDSEWRTGAHECVVSIRASSSDNDSGCFIGAMASAPRFP